MNPKQAIYLTALAIIWFISLVYWTSTRADDNPPSTKVLICRGSLPSLSLRDTADASPGCISYTISATSKDDPDLLNYNDDDTYRHAYYASGDPACIGTGKPIHSGRDCNEKGSAQCAYISQGYSIYAVTGKSCSEAGINLCTGFFCK